MRIRHNLRPARQLGNLPKNILKLYQSSKFHFLGRVRGGVGGTLRCLFGIDRPTDTINLFYKTWRDLCKICARVLVNKQNSLTKTKKTFSRYLINNHVSLHCVAQSGKKPCIRYNSICIGCMALTLYKVNDEENLDDTFFRRSIA